MVLLQIVAAGFAVFAITRVLLRVKEGKITLGESLLWFLLWLGMIVLAFVPEASSLIAKFLGIGRGLDLVFSAGLVAVFYLLFRLYVKIEQFEREMTLVVRETALKDIKDAPGRKKRPE